MSAGEILAIGGANLVFLLIGLVVGVGVASALFVSRDTDGDDDGDEWKRAKPRTPSNPTRRWFR